jgi:sugar phosphate isomerase/epimerase
VGRVDAVARRASCSVGMHNHSNVKDPNEFATPESFMCALAGASPYIAINLDIGHFTAANFDAVEFLKQHHARIVTLHIKDRKRDQGEKTPLSDKATRQSKQVLTLLRDNKWEIPANIEYEYEGKDSVQEVARCLAYCKEILIKG